MYQSVNFEDIQNLHRDYISVYNRIYALESLQEEEIEKIFLDIKNILIDTYNIYPSSILTDISNVAIYRNRYLSEYWEIFLKIYNEYKPSLSKNISIIFQYYIYKYLGIICDKSLEEKIKNYVSSNKSLKADQGNQLYQTIMNDDVTKMKELLENEEFDINQKLQSDFFPNPDHEYTLFELCSYYGADKCLLHLYNNYKFYITPECYELKFLNRSKLVYTWYDIKHRQTSQNCMKYALISHDIETVSSLMNNYSLNIDLDDCCLFNNLEAFLYQGDKLYNLQKPTKNIYKVKNKIYDLSKKIRKLVFKKIYYLGKEKPSISNDTFNLTDISEGSIYFSKFEILITQNSIKINDEEHKLHSSTVELINKLDSNDNWIFFNSNNSVYVNFILELISVKQFRDFLEYKAMKGYFQRLFAELLFKFNYLSETDIKACGNAWIQFLLDIYEGESLLLMNGTQNNISKLFIRNAMENFLRICNNLALFGPYTCILYIWNEKICQNSVEEKSCLNYFPLSIPFIPENHLAVNTSNLDSIVDLFEQGYKDILIYGYISEFHQIFVNFLDEYPSVDEFHDDYKKIIPKLKTRLISHNYSDQALSNFIDFFVRYFPDNELGISPEVEEDISKETGIDIKFFKKMNPNYNLEEEELEEKRNKEEPLEMYCYARYPLSEYYRQNAGYTFKTNLNFKVDDEYPYFG